MKNVLYHDCFESKHSKIAKNEKVIIIKKERKKLSAIKFYFWEGEG